MKLILAVGNIENIKNWKMILKNFLVGKRAMRLSWIATCKLKSKFFLIYNLYDESYKQRHYYFLLCQQGTVQTDHIIYLGFFHLWIIKYRSIDGLYCALIA